MNKNLKEYGDYLKDFDLTDEEKLEFIGALQYFVESTLNRKYGLDGKEPSSHL